MSTTEKSTKILPVIFSRYAAILSDDYIGPGAAPALNKTRYSGWDVRKDMARGTRFDTGYDSQYPMEDNGCSFAGFMKDLTRLYPLEPENCDQGYSLLPPVASL